MGKARFLHLFLTSLFTFYSPGKAKREINCLIDQIKDGQNMGNKSKSKTSTKSHKPSIPPSGIERTGGVRRAIIVPNKLITLRNLIQLDCLNKSWLETPDEHCQGDEQ